MRDVCLSNGISVQVRRQKCAKNIRISIRTDGSVSLTLPFFVSQKRGVAFLESKQVWIRENLLRFKNRPTLLSHGSKEELRERGSEAKQLIEERLEFYRTAYGVSWSAVSIRNQKTRWGSCSRDGRLSFNYRLLFLPEQLRDYVIVHELCHLKEFNHSPRFWNLVAQTFPDFKTLRKELRTLSMSL